MGDTAYPLSLTLITPYKRPEQHSIANRRFNQQLSSVRIDIEHAFGILKGRWQSLCGLRLRLKNQERYDFALSWIYVCVLLHNILIREDDKWEETDGWWTEDIQDEHDEALSVVNSDGGLDDGRRRREAMKGVVINWLRQNHRVQ